MGLIRGVEKMIIHLHLRHLLSLNVDDLYFRHTRSLAGFPPA